MTATDRPTPSEAQDWEAMLARPEFQELRRRLRSFVFPMTALFLAWYLLYVLMSMWAGDFMATTIVGTINVALVFGLLQFVTTFGIAYLYARHANRRFDPLAEELDLRLKEHPGCRRHRSGSVIGAGSSRHRLNVDLVAHRMQHKFGLLDGA